MKTYEFTLLTPDIDDASADSIYGLCPDSSIGKSNGRVYVAFDREAESLEAAMASAVADLRRLGVEPSRVELDVPDDMAA